MSPAKLMEMINDEALTIVTLNVGDGDAIVGWTAFVPDRKLRAARFNAAGTPIGPEFTVSTTTACNPAEPEAAAGVEGAT